MGSGVSCRGGALSYDFSMLIKWTLHYFLPDTLTGMRVRPRLAWYFITMIVVPLRSDNQFSVAFTHCFACLPCYCFHHCIWLFPANIGGTLGLCIGASLLTICEFIEFGLLSCLRGAKRCTKSKNNSIVQPFSPKKQEKTTTHGNFDYKKNSIFSVN